MNNNNVIFLEQHLNWSHIWWSLCHWFCFLRFVFFKLNQQYFYSVGKIVVLISLSCFKTQYWKKKKNYIYYNYIHLRQLIMECLLHMDACKTALEVT